MSRESITGAAITTPATKTSKEVTVRSCTRAYQMPANTVVQVNSASLSLGDLLPWLAVPSIIRGSSIRLVAPLYEYSRPLHLTIHPIASVDVECVLETL